MLIGPALALSSTAFVLQLLTEQKSLTSTYGRTSFSVLLLQDLAVVPLLALVPLLTMPELSIGKDIGLALVESLLILGLIVLVGRYLLHPILHRVALSGKSEVFYSFCCAYSPWYRIGDRTYWAFHGYGCFLAGYLFQILRIGIK